MNKARRKEIAAIVAELEGLKDRLETIASDEREAFDNMPESLQESERGQTGMTEMHKKGDKVTYIERWNAVGDFYTRDATVYSCGKKRMVLTDDVTGEEFGREMNPTSETVVPRAAATPALIAERMRTWRNDEIARLRHCLTINGGARYEENIRRTLAALESHMPTVSTYAGRLAELKAGR